MQSILDFFTNDSGIIAAIAAIIGLVGGILAITEKWPFRPVFKIASLKIQPPPPSSEAGKISFQLLNAGKGKVVLTDMFLVVSAHGTMDKIKETEAAAGLEQLTYKVKLNPSTTRYDVRKKRFGPPAEPRSYESKEVESYIIELSSVEPQWYKFHLEIAWYNTSKSNKTKTLKSKELYIEFLKF